MEANGEGTKRSHFYRTPNDNKNLRRWGTAEEISTKGHDPVRNRFDSPIKLVAYEDALGKPLNSFSFDEDFGLESETSEGAIDENWSPVAMG